MVLTGRRYDEHSAEALSRAINEARLVHQSDQSEQQPESEEQPMTLELEDRARVRAQHPLEVLHVTRSFYAEPTLSQQVASHSGWPVHVRELPLPEAIVRLGRPDLIWASSAEPEDVDLLRTAFPHAALLVSVAREAPPAAIIELYDRGADLVVTDEGVRHAAAAVMSLLRRRSRFTANTQGGAPA